MFKFYLGIILAVFIINANTISIDYDFEFNGVERSVFNNYSIVRVKGLSSYGDVGYPELPVKRVKILIPYGYEYESISVKGDYEIIEGKYNISPTQRAIPISSAPVRTQLDKNVEAYRSPVSMPDNLCENPKVFQMKGYNILTANLSPVQYTSNTGEIRFYSNLKVCVNLKSTAHYNSDLYRGISEDREEILKSVDNPEVVNSYPLKSTNRQDLDGVIITGSTLMNEFERLVTWKKSLGLNLKVVNVSNAISSSSGRDNAEKLRSYIKSEYLDNNISYVILAGDVNIVPHKILYNNNTYDNYYNQFPCDLYFAGLDGSWDGDGDGFFGEFHYDSADYYAEVFVGRLPVETVSEAAAVIDKIIKFESNPRSKKVSLHSSMMDDTNSSRDVKEGNDHTDSIGCHDYVPSDYEVFTLYQEDGKTNNTNYIAEWNRGLLMINHCGHGLERGYSISRHGDNFRNPDAYALTNDIHPIHASISCLTGSFDWETEDCIAEKLLLNPNGGVVSTVQNSRNGLYSYGNALKHSGELDIEMYRQIFEEGVPSLGEAVQRAREEFAYQAHMNSSYNQVVYVWNLIGDPTLKILDEPVGVSLKLDSPAGGEIFKQDSLVNIDWRTIGDTSSLKIKLEYSSTGKKGPWELIAEDEIDDSSYTWRIPSIESDSCFLKLSAYESNSSEAVASVISNSPFSITAAVSLKNDLNRLHRKTFAYKQNRTIILSGEFTKGDKIKVTDLKGRLVYSEDIGTPKISVKIPEIASGIFIIQHVRSQQIIWSGKIFRD